MERLGVRNSSANDRTVTLSINHDCCRYATPTETAVQAAFDMFERPVEKNRENAGKTPWLRVDNVRAKRAGNADGLQGHAIADSLGVRAGALTAYRMYVRPDGREVAVVVRFADGVYGHKGILHGGISALLFDEVRVPIRVATKLFILEPP